MENKSQFLLDIFFLLVLFFVGFSYYNFVIKKNFITFYSEDAIPAQTDIKSIINLP